ncbi:MAG: VWA domain-containing protein [Limnohabitans sp.]|nr:VWA domain-containing protein [Limnohabitans sp.]
MHFVWPEALWSLLVLPLLWAGYVWMLRRQRAQALRFPSLLLLRPALQGQRAWRRHVPPLLLWLALACSLVALARPFARVALPADYMTLVMALDVSRSMLAQDVPPNRIEAAKAAAKAFIQELPAQVRVGIVSFAGSAQLAQQVTDEREALLTAIDRFELQRGTATGSGLLLALATLLPDAGIQLESALYGSAFGGYGAPGSGARPLGSAAPASTAKPPPVPVGSYTSGAIILLSDGRRTTGLDPMDAARQAADLGVRVHTVAFGTPDGVIPGMEGYSFFARVDEETLQAVAKVTGGEFFRAQNAQDLNSVYAKLSSRVALESRDTEVSVLWALAALLLVVSSLGLSMHWLRRA